MSLCGRGLPSFPHSCFLLARPWVDEVCWEGWCSLDDCTFLPSTETERRTQPEISSGWKPGKAAAEVALLYSSVLLLGPVLYLPEILSSPHQASTATCKKLGTCDSTQVRLVQSTCSLPVTGVSAGCGLQGTCPVFLHEGEPDSSRSTAVEPGVWHKGSL